jgi:hypothetical protein
MPYNADGSKKKNPSKSDMAKYHNNKSSAYAKAIRAGSQSPMGSKKTGTTGAAGA